MHLLLLHSPSKPQHVPTPAVPEGICIRMGSPLSQISNTHVHTHTLGNSLRPPKTLIGKGKNRKEEGFTPPYKQILLSVAGLNMSLALSGPNSSERAPSLLPLQRGCRTAHGSLTKPWYLPRYRKEKQQEFHRTWLTEEVSWHQNTPCPRGLSFCQQASAINNLVLGLKGAKKPLRFFLFSVLLFLL